MVQVTARLPYTLGADAKQLSLPRFQGQCLKSCSGAKTSYTGKTF